MKPVFKRILIKLSGEALKELDTTHGFDTKEIDRIALEIGKLTTLGVEVGLVIGGGNLVRGKILSDAGFDRITGDQMGMLATLMNVLAMRDALERAGFLTRAMSALSIGGIFDLYDRRKAIYHLSEGKIVLFAGGTGNPFVTTDSAASLRAIEINADLLVKATNVDGVYSSDPRLDPKAQFYPKITYKEVINKELKVMDLIAFMQCSEHKMPLCVFNVNKSNALANIVTGLQEGTLVNVKEVL